MLYNGLENDLKTFAEFIYIYETSIKFKSKVDEFGLISQKAAQLFKKNIQPKVKYATKNEIADFIDESKKQSLFFTKDNNAQIFCFCRHLRNSFGHALLRKERQKLYITDKYRGQETAKGDLDYQDVIDFIVMIIKDYKNKNK